MGIIKFGVSVSSTVFLLVFSGMDSMINSNLKDHSWVFGIHFSLGRGGYFFPFIVLYCTIALSAGGFNERVCFLGLFYDSVFL